MSDQSDAVRSERRENLRALADDLRRWATSVENYPLFDPVLAAKLQTLANTCAELEREWT